MGQSPKEQDKMLSIKTGIRALGARTVQVVSAGFLAMAVLAAPLARQAQAEGAALETAMDAVLVVRSDDAEDRFLGSAFLWGEEAVVAVTNAHVVGEAEEVRLIDRHGEAVTGTVIARDETRDVAVISLPPRADGHPRRGLVPAAVPAGLGDEVYALGAPLGIEFTLTEGRISSTARQVELTVPLRLVQHDAAVNPGSSGGPLVDAQGQLLGMNSQIADGSRMFVGIAYAIAAQDLTRLVQGLIDETLAPMPKLGLGARPVDRKVAEALGVAAEGLLVDSAAAGGLAAAAGLRPGDLILAVDGTALREPGDFAFLIEAALGAGEAALTVRRGGEDLGLTLGFLPAEEAPALGLKVRELPASATEPARVASYRLGALGVVLADNGTVREVTQNSPALFAGLAKGDRILAVNGQTVDGAALAGLEISEPALLLVSAPDGSTRHIYLDPWGALEGGVRPLGGANVLDPAVVVF